ncbi:uncharacterized protein LOC124267911 [Haliotis rubra]|uniref:uncharacterized protein LOC124267911 n=1 Tax=Haliotis rubra TaxID=36100 RepID=UPI001EE605DF|nr:uncharacterized protein LOC124267911 [Haliotis rubra]XP_046558854.1 uncharacterized protein LOC124267911 [Haliotis rubra]XP_046558855.1 uncharacterized protein LOC124267911 [Haliotis rubra]
MAGNRAPSCHMWFDDGKKGDILMQDVYVPSHGVTQCTYYCCLQWNGGLNGGGYCGIQEHPDGQCYIFSIWDPTTTNEAIEAVYRHEGTKTEKFGGEGTGLKSMNFKIGWKPDHWYTVVARRWDYKGHTYFGFWVRDQVANKWFHLVTMDFPVPEIYFETPTVCFIEDWIGNGDKYRRVNFKNGYKRTTEGSWLPFQKATFNVLQEDACRLYNDNYDGGIDGTSFFMQTGKGTTPSPILATDRRFRCQDAANSEPSNDPICFTIKEVTSKKVTWSVPESSTPQFAYRVIVDGLDVACEVDPDKRSCSINATCRSEVKVVLQDIIGRRRSWTLRVE